ncbi:oxidoreductase [Albibacillus kandeliae]|uniref:oxidoreductase n=1 Tax=Albibacillus kandeliae TaxID=2174228 RepID=UPI000D690EFE|nr:oxidoreductase [Albibacillus kandeliae]
MTLLSRTLQAAACLALLLPLPLAAQDLPVPEGEPVLTVSGAIGQTNAGDTAVFDMAMLEGMEPVTIETSTIWTEGVQSFTGVPLHVLMDAVGATGEVLSAKAINDYAVDIPIADWSEGGAIVAFLNNGEPMSTRDKGPLWVVYPYDSRTEYQSEVIYSRSIWQLDRITVK